MTNYLPLIIFAVLFIAMFYFAGIRPLRQREKKHDQMVLELEKGDTVITKVDIIYEDSIVLTVESGAKIRVTKGGVVKREDEY